MYTRILLATDGSELATRGLTHGLDLAKALGVPVIIVTATETWSPLEIAAEARRGAPRPTAEFDEIATNAARGILDVALGLAAERGVAAEGLHMPHSRPAEAILQAAAERGCDLIVMASHGRRGVRRVWLGSQAAEVVTDGRIPVIIVR